MSNEGIGSYLRALAGPFAANAALYFSRLLMDFAPCCAAAGVIARTDAERGVWKPPAGEDARLLGVLETRRSTHED